jgi:nitrite reductase/ring-hydroxylating ferredoxin subunit
VETRRVRVAPATDIPLGTMIMVEVDDTDILLVNVDGTVRAYQGRCSHERYPLDEGFLFRTTLTCNLHGSRFDMLDGAVLDPPAEQDLKSYPVSIEDGRVVLELPVGSVPVN